MRYRSILFNGFLLLVAAIVLATVGVKVYRQLHYQMTDPHGGDSMWPVTFLGLAVLASALAAIAAFSILFNHSHTKLLRVSAAVSVVTLLAMWLYSSILLHRTYDSFTGPSEYSYTELTAGSVLERMALFEGRFFLGIATAMLSVCMVVGRGPIVIISDRLNRRRRLTK